MINVMYIVNEIGLGGAAQSLLDMLQGLGTYINPTVVIPGHGVLENWLRLRNVNYYVVPFSSGFGKLGKHFDEDEDANYLNNYSAALNLKKIAIRDKIHLIHSNSSVSNVGAMLAIILKIPHVWHLREFGEEDFGCEFFDKKLKRELFNYADVVITISDSVKKSYLKKYGVDSICIYNGLDIKRYIAEIDEKIYGKSFLLAGAFIPEKGHMEAVKAAEYLRNTGDPIVLKLAGAGDERFIWMVSKYIKQRNLEKNIEILPFIENLAEIRRKCDFVITASRKEALGRVTLEAMLAGNVVIGADTGGTLELIGENQERGYLYRQGDYMSLAASMKLAMQNGRNSPANLTILRKRAQKYVIDNFDTQSYAQQIIKIYKDAINRYAEKDIKLAEYMDRKLRKRYKKLISKRIISNKHDDLLGRKLLKGVLSRWEYIENNKYSISDFFIQNRFEKVAIYGMAYLGCKLYDELEGKGIQIEYVIDRTPGLLDKALTTYKPEDSFPEVNCIIITALKEEEQIKTFLQQKYDYQVYGISQILDLLIQGIKYGKN